MEARGSSSVAPATGIGSGVTGRSGGRGTPSRSTSPQAAQDPSGDAHADSGGSQQATRVPATQTQRITAAGEIMENLLFTLEMWITFLFWEHSVSLNTLSVQ